MLGTWGLEFAETMSGTYLRSDETEACTPHPLSFSARVRIHSLVDYMRTHKASIRGEIYAPGLADVAPIHGSMVISPVVRRLIRYDFGFTGDDGNPYRFHGEKTLTAWRFLRALTVLPAQIFDGTGTCIARCNTRFHLRSDLLPMLRSVRLA